MIFCLLYFLVFEKHVYRELIQKRWGSQPRVVVLFLYILIDFGSKNYFACLPTRSRIETFSFIIKIYRNSCYKNICSWKGKNKFNKAPSNLTIQSTYSSSCKSKIILVWYKQNAKKIKNKWIKCKLNQTNLFYCAVYMTTFFLFPFVQYEI